MDRRKQLINQHEAATRRILVAAAANNGAEAFPKLRIADVLRIDRSGIARDLFDFALRSHFDFVVADSQHMPLFAVEFDGPHHARDERARSNDLKKNAVCNAFDFPLARVRDEHIFRKARGMDYLTWLTELFFSFRELVRAQETGVILADEDLDPMSFVTHPHIPGRFPLAVASTARMRLLRLSQTGVLVGSMPYHIHGEDDSDNTGCLMLIQTASGETLVVSASIYIRGVGISPAEAANEIATNSLVEIAESHATAGSLGFQACEPREMIIRFLRGHTNVGWGGPMGLDLGFKLAFSQSGGEATWRVGRLDDEPEVVISARK